MTCALGPSASALMVVLFAAVLASPPSRAAGPATTVDPEAELERAARCLRRADFTCAEHHANLVLGVGETLTTELRREALAIATAAIARAATPGDDARAQAKCSELLAVWPTYEPPPDADPRLVAACAAARKAAMEARLPTVLDPGPAPLPEPADVLPDPVIYKPARLDDLPPEDKRFSVALGAGIAIPIGASGDRFEPGVQAALELRYAFDEQLALWVGGALALLRLSSDLPVEPHQGTSLTSFMAVMGLEYALPVASQVELVTALGLGVGGFGIAAADEAMGLALAPLVGARYLAADNLSVRLDFSPTFIIPVNGIAPAGHLAFVVRGEARF